MVVLLFITASLAGVCGNAEEAPSPDMTAPPASVEQVPHSTFSPSWSEGLVWRTIDDHLQLRMGAYIMCDWTGAGQSGGLDPVAPSSGSGFHVRDSQIDIHGVLYKETQFRLQFDVNGGRPELQDNYLQRDGIPYLGSIRLGYFKGPFGLENSTSLRHAVFMERSLADTLTTARGIGIAMGNAVWEKRLTWGFGAFWDADDFEKLSESRSFSFVGRLTGVVFRRDGCREQLHVGISLGRRFMKDTLRYEARPEVNTAPRYLDTGDFSAKTLTLLNLESAYVRGPLLLQGECIWTWTSGGMRTDQVTLNDIADEVASRYPWLTDWLQGHSGWQRPSNSVLWSIPFDMLFEGDALFFGIYGQASYVLTGEPRPYDAQRGVFGAPAPEHPFSFRTFRGVGAWEVAARLSHLDLNEGYVRGGRETNATLGLNWYLNENMRMALNYVHGRIGRDTCEGSMDAVQMRMQIDLQPRRLGEFHPLRTAEASVGATYGGL